MALLSRNLDVKKICLRVGAVWVEIIRIKSRKSDSTKDKGRERERESEFEGIEHHWMKHRAAAPLYRERYRRGKDPCWLTVTTRASQTRGVSPARAKGIEEARLLRVDTAARIWKRLSGAWRSRLMKNECVCSPRHRSLRYQDVSTAFSRRFATQ